MVRDLKVYVWPNWLMRDYHSGHLHGHAVAIARSLDEAKSLIAEESGFKYDEKIWGPHAELPLTSVGFFCAWED